MAKLKQLESFVSVVARGSLTAAARAEGVARAIMGRRHVAFLVARFREQHADLTITLNRADDDWEVIYLKPAGIYARVPQRRHLPLRVRLQIDFLKHRYRQAGFWVRQ